MDYNSAAVNQVIRLFKQETGEQYAEASVRHLPIPQWDGNLVLVDLEEDEPRTIHGVFYGTPFMDDIVRVAAFVIAESIKATPLGARRGSGLTPRPGAKGSGVFNSK